MGSEELIEALRADARARTAEIQARAEEQALAADEEAQAEIQSIRRESEDRLRDFVERQRRETLARAERQGRAELAKAESEMAARLHRAALSELALMRQRLLYRPEHILEFAQELPGQREFWRRVFVNPADEHEARRIFRSAAIRTEPAITGGMRAESEDGQISVDNTLDCRLERAWPAMLPDLIRDLHERDD